MVPQKRGAAKFNFRVRRGSSGDSASPLAARLILKADGLPRGAGVRYLSLRL
jgi:hypothetical protein